jgi:hypothetical protein
MTEKHKEVSMYSQSVGLQLLFTFAIACTVILSGCGGTKILKEPLALEITKPLVTASDQNVSAELIWVIVRDGPGTWAEYADWDEYLVNVVNESGEMIQIIDVTIVDSLGVRQATNADYRELVNESKETTKRYKDSNLTVKAGIGFGTMMAVGGTTILGASVGYFGAAAINGVLMSATTGLGGAAAGTATAVGGFVVLVPAALVYTSIVQNINRNKVAKEIWKRHTFLPVTINSHQDLLLDIFYPLAPSPTQLEITYMVAGVEETLVVNTSEALNGLHLFQHENEKLEKHLATLGISTTSEASESSKSSKANEIGRDGTFIAYDDGTILDTKTKIMWWWSSTEQVKSWSDTQFKSKNFRGGGYSDCRVPSIEQLKTIYVKSSKYKYKTIDFITLTSPFIISKDFEDSGFGDSGPNYIQYIDFRNRRVGSCLSRGFKFASGEVMYLPVREAN